MLRTMRYRKPLGPFPHCSMSPALPSGFNAALISDVVLPVVFAIERLVNSCAAFVFAAA